MDGQSDFEYLAKTFGVKTPTGGADRNKLLAELRGAAKTQESSGNYSAVNPDTYATGAFQVLPENVPNWTQKHLKRRMTVEEFKSDKTAQEKVFDGEMGEYLDEALKRSKGDPLVAKRMAAAAWYGGLGNMHLYDDPKPQYSKGRKYPSFREYTTKVAGSSLPDLPETDFNELSKTFLNDQGTAPAGTDFNELSKTFGVDPAVPDSSVQTSNVLENLNNQKLILFSDLSKAKNLDERKRIKDSISKLNISIDEEKKKIPFQASESNLPPNPIYNPAPEPQFKPYEGTDRRIPSQQPQKTQQPKFGVSVNVGKMQPAEQVQQTAQNVEQPLQSFELPNQGLVDVPDNQITQGSAGTVVVDLKNKPKGENTGRYQLRTALQQIAPKYGLSNEEINQGIDDLFAQYGRYTQVNDGVTDEQIQQLIQSGANTLVQVSPHLELINRILNKRDGGTGLNPALQTDVQMQTAQGAVGKRDLSGINEKYAEEEAKKQIENSIRNPELSWEGLGNAAGEGLSKGIKGITSPFGWYENIRDMYQKLSDLYAYKGGIPEEKVKELADKQINEIKRDFGSFSEYKKTQDYISGMDTGEFALRVGANYLRSTLNQAISSNLKGIDVVDSYIEKVNPLRYIIGEKYNPSIRNLENALGYTIAYGLGKGDKFQRATDQTPADRRLFYTIGKQVEESLGQDKYLRSGFFKVASETLGSITGFMLLGLVAPELSVRTRLGEFSLTSAAGGALAESASMYEQARQKNLSENDALFAGFIGTLSGATEGFGAGAALNKALARSERQALVKFIVDFAEEGGQEALQNVTEDAFWKYLEDKDASLYQKIKNVISDLPDNIGRNAIQNGIPAGFFGSLFGKGVDYVVGKVESGDAVNKVEVSAPKPLTPDELEQKIAEVNNNLTKERPPESRENFDAVKTSQGILSEQETNQRETEPDTQAIEVNQAVMVEGKGEGIVVEDKGNSVVVEYNNGNSRILVRKNQVSPITRPLQSEVPENKQVTESAQAKPEVLLQTETQQNPEPSSPIAAKREFQPFELPEKRSAPRHDFSTTQVNLPDEIGQKVIDFGKKLFSKNDLTNQGQELNPHITTKFGLETDEVDEVKKLLEGIEPFQVTLGKTSIFRAKKGQDYDVVKIDVDSPKLHSINKLISDNVKNVQTQPSFVPHLTLARVKAGTGEKYAGKTDFEGQKITFDKITFSDRNGNEFDIKLGKLQLNKETSQNQEVSANPALEEVSQLNKNQAKLNKLAKEKRLSSGRKFDPTKYTLSTFVRQSGGIRPNRAIDLAAIRDANEYQDKKTKKGKQRKGFASLLRDSGIDVEDMFRSAVEAGFFSDKNTEYSPGAENIANQYADFDVDDFVEAVAADANKTAKYVTVEAIDLIAGTIEEQQNKYWEEKAKEEGISLNDEEFDETISLGLFLKDPEVRQIVKKLAETGELSETEKENFVQIGVYEKSIERQTVENLLDELIQSAAASPGTADELAASDSESNSDVRPGSEEIYLEDLDETEPDGEVDTSFDFADETPPSKEDTKADSSSPNKAPANLFGEEIQPKFQDSLFGKSGTDVEAEKAIRRELTEAYGEKTGKFVEQLAKNPNPLIARVADDLIKARKLVAAKGEDAAEIVETAADGLEIFVKAQTNKISVEEQLTQKGMFDAEISPAAQEYARQMETGRFSAEFNKNLSTVKKGNHRPDKNVPPKMDTSEGESAPETETVEGKMIDVMTTARTADEFVNRVKTGWIEGYSSADIAEALNISETASNDEKISALKKWFLATRKIYRDQQDKINQISDKIASKTKVASGLAKEGIESTGLINEQDYTDLSALEDARDFTLKKLSEAKQNSELQLTIQVGKNQPVAAMKAADLNKDWQFNENELNLFDDEGNINYEELKNISDGIERGDIKIARLNEAEERGRIEGGRRNVEASVIAGTKNSPSGRTGTGEESRYLGWDEHKENVKPQEEALEQYAKDQGIWIDYDTLHNDYDFFKPGTESDVFFDKDDDNYLIKANAYDFAQRQTPLEFIDRRIAVHNSLFPGTKYELVGFTRDKGGNFRFLLRQHFITKDGVITDSELKDHLRINYGLTETGLYEFSNERYIISDLHEENRIKSKAGIIHFIDPIINFNTENVEVPPFAVRSNLGATNLKAAQLESIKNELAAQEAEEIDAARAESFKLPLLSAKELAEVREMKVPYENRYQGKSFTSNISVADYQKKLQAKESVLEKLLKCVRK